MSYKKCVIKCLEGWIRSEPRKNYSKAYKICLDSIELASIQSKSSLWGLDGFSKGLIEKIHHEIQSMSEESLASPCSPVRIKRIGRRCRRCPGCLRPPCNECKECKNRLTYKKACRERICQGDWKYPHVKPDIKSKTECRNEELNKVVLGSPDVLEWNTTSNVDYTNKNRKQLPGSAHHKSSVEVSIKQFHSVKNKEGIVKQFRCSNCGEGFSRQFNLTRHRLNSCTSKLENKKEVKISSVDFDIQEGSPCMAVLKALAFNTDNTTCLLKQDLISKAQKLTNQQLLIKDCKNIGEYTNTWKKINNMVSKGLLLKQGLPVQYRITQKGREIVDDACEGDINTDDEDVNFSLNLASEKEEKVSDANNITDNDDSYSALNLSSEKSEKVCDAGNISDNEDSFSSLNLSSGVESNDETCLSHTLETKKMQKEFEDDSDIECQGCINRINGHICDQKGSLSKTLKGKKTKAFRAEFQAESKRVPILIQQEKNRKELLSLISAALPPSSSKSSNNGKSSKIEARLENSTQRRSNRKRVLWCKNSACRQQFLSTAEQDQHCRESPSCNFEYYD